MKARVEKDWLTDSMKVTFFDHTPSGTVVYDLPSGTATILKDGEEAPEPLRFPRDSLAALVAEASGILPPSAATTAHLQDAVAVRDRLLTLVERRTSDG